MAFEVRTAERKQSKLKLSISGPSGSGKTYSSLLLASGIVGGKWEKITLIDTENGSGELYADLGPYKVLPFPAPWSPDRYVEALKVAIKSGAEVVIIDSISHEWEGEGGELQMHSDLGGQFQHWNKVAQKRKPFVSALLSAPAHVIALMREKHEYVVNLDDKTKKQKPEKKGLKPIQKEGIEYEFTIGFHLEMNHYAVASKDRTGLFMPRGDFKITPETGTELMVWMHSGKKEELPVEAVIAPTAPLANATDKVYRIPFGQKHPNKELHELSHAELEEYVSIIVKNMRNHSGELLAQEQDFVKRATIFLSGDDPYKDLVF